MAELLFDFLEPGNVAIHLTPAQVAEIERGLADSEPYASDAEVRALFQRLTKEIKNRYKARAPRRIEAIQLHRQGRSRCRSTSGEAD